MAEITYIRLYYRYLDALSTLSDAARGRLIMAMLEYAKSGTAPDLKGGAKTLWPLFRNQIDQDKQHYDEVCEKRRNSGRMGGRPLKNTPDST